MAGKQLFRNAVPACVILRKSFRNAVPARSVTKIPLILAIHMKFRMKIGLLKYILNFSEIFSHVLKITNMATLQIIDKFQFVGI
jgi:hypothetical protein